MSKTPEPGTGGQGHRGPAPAQVLDEMRLIRERTSAVAHAYWLPLLLFGLAICGSVPFYERLQQSQLHPARLPAACAPGQPCHIDVGAHYRIAITALGWYWQIAIPVAVVLTVLWYRWRAARVGLRTPARGFLITGLVLGELVLLVSLLITVALGRPDSLVSDFRHIGTVLVITAVLWVLAWAERSRALASIVAVVLVVALPVSIATGGGIAGGSTGAADLSLTSLRLLGLAPALILLVGGAGAWLRQRAALRRSPT
jgi:hypothetical protein